jgi:hypothetical protein
MDILAVPLSARTRFQNVLRVARRNKGKMNARGNNISSGGDRKVVRFAEEASLTTIRPLSVWMN